jgi:uncharacterized iron-regulated membrane protein
MKLLYRKLHRWVCLVFAAPLAVVLATGLILSVEPIVQSVAIRPGSVTQAALEAMIASVDSTGTATSLTLLPYENAALVGSTSGSRAFDLATGLPTEPGWLSTLFGVSRGLHERLLLDLGWLVIASTVALLALVGLGLMMGLPRLRNSVAGWHKATGWFLLPLVVLSPLTGLGIALGITFAGPAPASSAAIPTIAAAIHMIGAEHDVSALSSIRRRGPTLMARIYEGGELRAFAVTDGGVVALERNWPRLLHEGNGAALITGPLNIVTSLALIGLLGTGLFMWARRSLLRSRRSRSEPRTIGLPDRSAVAGESASSR